MSPVIRSSGHPVIQSSGASQPDRPSRQIVRFTSSSAVFRATFIELQDRSETEMGSAEGTPVDPVGEEPDRIRSRDPILSTELSRAVARATIHDKTSSYVACEPDTYIECEPDAVGDRGMS
jgi:hypothetical protein